MMNRPMISVLLPWSFEQIAKTVQGAAKKNRQIRIGGDRFGMRVTATPQDFLHLGMAKESGTLSDPIVGRLRTAKIPVLGARTVHLPGRVSVVEISTSVDPEVARKIANTIVKQGSPDVITIYDREGTGHTATAKGLAQKGAALFEIAPQCNQVGSRVSKRVKAAENSKHNALVTAIRDIWEANGEDMVQLIDWDLSGYEAPEVQDLIRGVLAQYLSEDQLETWEGLESEVQSAILDRAFPRNAIKTTQENLDRHFESQCRGAARTLEARVDPLDIGLKDPENLVKVNGRGSINDLF